MASLKWTCVLPIVALASGCVRRPPACTPVRPLLDQGEVFIYAPPFEGAARRLTFSFASVQAVRSDGKASALEHQEIRGQATRSRLVLWGRLPPGQYRALRLQVRRATLGAGSGASDLLVSKESSEIAASFEIRRRSATLLRLEPKPDQLVRQMAFTPAFRLGSVPRGSTQHYGYCANSGSQTLSVFDVLTRKLVSIIATGEDPRGMAVDPIQHRLYLALAAEDEIAVIDIASGEPIERIRLQPGDGPRELALLRDGSALISTNARANTVSFVDLRGANAEGQRLRTGEDPTGILLDRTGQRAYVFNARSNDITVVDTTQRAVVATIATEAGPLRGQVDRANRRLFVAHRRSANMLVLSIPDYKVIDRVFVGLGMTAIKVDPNTDLVYVADDGGRRLSIYDAASLARLDEVRLSTAVNEMVISDADNTMLLLGAERRLISVMDLTSRKVRPALDVGCGPYMIRLTNERR